MKLISGIIVVAVIFSFVSCVKKESDLEHKGSQTTQPAASERQVSHYTCGMHPSVRVSPQEYAKGSRSCPICNMDLTPVYKEAKGSTSQEHKGSGYKGETDTGRVVYGCGFDTEGKCPHCDQGLSDSECICGQHSFVIEGEKIDCPVCGRQLRELTPEETDKLKGVVSRVTIKGDQIQRAGVETAPIKKLHLYKEIRTVGKVAYDPDLAIAQEEFISTLKTVDKMQEGLIPEIKERAGNLVESSKRKLRLLGLSYEQISQLESAREIHTSLVLPEAKMWIYGDVYEYEISWVTAGQKVKVTTSSFAGEEFNGVISSINPVLDPKTRSVRFRAEVENPGLRLKPQMYVDVVIMSMYTGPDGEQMVVAVPKDAVLDTGTRQIVWVDKGNGAYEGIQVKLGPEATSTVEGSQAKFYPVLKGPQEGERKTKQSRRYININQ
jgi:hypothetical protein